MSLTASVAAMRPSLWPACVSEGMPCPFSFSAAVRSGPGGADGPILIREIRAVPGESLPFGCAGRNGFGRLREHIRPVARHVLTPERICKNLFLHRLGKKRIYASPKFARARGRSWGVSQDTP